MYDVLSISREKAKKSRKKRHFLINKQGKKHTHGIMFVCMVAHVARVWTNRVRLLFLLVVSWTGEINISLSAFAPDNFGSLDGFGSPIPRQPAHLYTQAEYGAYLRDLSRVPRRRPFIHLEPPYAIGSVPSLSGYAIAYRWRSLAVPSPSETWFRGMSVGGSFRRVYGRAHPQEMQPTDCNRDSACWLRQSGGMVSGGWCSQLRASSELQFGAPRESGGTREAGSTVTESRVVLYRVSTHQIRRRRRVARSSTSQGRAEPLYARITGLNREVSKGKGDV